MENHHWDNRQTIYKWAIFYSYIELPDSIVLPRNHIIEPNCMNLTKFQGFSLWTLHFICLHKRDHSYLFYHVIWGRNSIIVQFFGGRGWSQVVLPGDLVGRRECGTSRWQGAASPFNWILKLQHLKSCHVPGMMFAKHMLKSHDITLFHLFWQFLDETSPCQSVQGGMQQVSECQPSSLSHEVWPLDPCKQIRLHLSS